MQRQIKNRSKEKISIHLRGVKAANATSGKGKIAKSVGIRLCQAGLI